MGVMKYKLTKEIREDFGVKLYRIVALRDFADVKKGDLGGWVESERNLSQEDNCWIYDDAVVYEKARILDNAKIRNKAIIDGHALIYDNSEICDAVQIKQNAAIFDNVKILDKAIITGFAWICDNSVISGNAIISNGKIHDSANIKNCTISGFELYILGDAYIQSDSDILIINNIGNENSTVSFYKTQLGVIKVTYSGSKIVMSLDKFEKKIEKFKDTKSRKEFEIAVELAKIKFGTQND